MQDICCKLSRTAAVVMIFLAVCVGSAWASGVPWQVGDIVVCYGGGQCNVIRLHGNNVQVLDTISDASISGLGGNNFGVGLNNTLHVIATDNGGGGSSKVVVYSIASVQPFQGTPLTHTVINNPPFDASAVTGDSSAAVAVNSAGHIFVGNSNTNGASIVELNASGSAVSGSSFTFPTSGDCATKTLTSVDLSSAGDAVYVTAGDGVIRKVSLALVSSVYTLAGATCAKFADFGSNVKLYGIKDIPAGALANVTPNCNGATCPADEALLVVATGDTDPDAGESEVGSPDPDAINICTNQLLQNSPSVSCGLLIDTNSTPPGLTTPFWQPNGGPGGTLYQATSVDILDPYLHIQRVSMPGTSGVDEPSFARIGNGTTLDNAVVWTDQGVRQWGVSCASCNVGPPFTYAANEIIIDPSQHVQQVTTAGLSGDLAPTWNDSGMTTKDGLKWQNKGVFAWTPSTSYTVPTNPLDSHGIVVDSAGHVQDVSQAGVSGPGPDGPTFADGAGATTLDGLEWANTGSPTCPAGFTCNTWQPTTFYCFDAVKCPSGPYITDAAGTVWVVTSPTLNATPGGKSGSSPGPTFVADGSSVAGPLPDDAVLWADQGGWTKNTSYSFPATVGDSNSNLWQVSVGGTSDGVSAPNFTADDSLNAFAFENNAVTWTDRGNWQPNTIYHVGGMVGDGQQHLLQVIAAPSAVITGASESGTLVTISTAAPHGFVVGQQVAVAGVGTGYNGVFAIAGVTSSTFTYTANSSGLAPSAGGTATVSDAGTSGPGPQPSFSHGVGATTPDGLQWTYISGTSPTIVARYPAGVNTLQSLALDPLVSNCTGGSPAGTACSTGSLPPRTVTDSNSSVTPSFWMGGTAGGLIYRQNFAGGTPASFNAATGGSGVQSLVVYGGESANQPGLASLVLNKGLASLQNTASANFLQNKILSTLSNNNGTQLSSTATPISLYASAVDASSCFNDPSAGSIGCQPFIPATLTTPGTALVLKIDIPLNGTLAVPATQTLNTAITPPAGTFDNGTDVFVDEQFDDTTFVGGDPGTRTVSVHSLHEVGGAPFGVSGCQFSSPLANTCYKLNRSTLNFIFSCPGLPPSQVQTLNPVLSLVKKTTGQAPQFIPISGATATNGKPAFRYNATNNFWTYQLNLAGFAAGTYLGTAFDLSNQVQSLTTGTFRLDATCK